MNDRETRPPPPPPWPEIIDPADAEKETELAVLSAVAHGNGPSGLTVVQAALAGLGRLDQAHAMVYFQLIWNGLREYRSSLNM